ncbi:MAG: hypothetical protein DRN04_10700 [Thermoprotei archaeon]|nr:MAG: hypothetical protein DRN04_10700 [Thermoprotei archaeon]
MDKPLDTVKEYLKQMGLSEENIKEGPSGITAHFEVEVSGEGEGEKISVEIPISFFALEDWVNCFTILLDLSSIPEETDLQSFLLSLLRANMSIPELNFGIIGNYLGLYAWMHSSALSYENFVSEVEGIINGAVVFATKILPGFPEIQENLVEECS